VHSRQAPLDEGAVRSRQRDVDCNRRCRSGNLFGTLSCVQPIANSLGTVIYLDVVRQLRVVRGGISLCLGAVHRIPPREKKRGNRIESAPRNEFLQPECDPWQAAAGPLVDIERSNWLAVLIGIEQQPDVSHPHREGDANSNWKIIDDFNLTIDNLVPEAKMPLDASNRGEQGTIDIHGQPLVGAELEA
jgi:hypothetical protein